MLNLLGFDYVHEMRYIVSGRVLFEKYSGLVYLFYDTASDRMKMIPADPDFRAYFLTELGAKLPNSRYIIGRKKVTKFDRIKYEDREFLKVETSEPIGVRTVSEKTRGEVWENRVLFHLTEAYDKKIVFGCNHVVLEGRKKLDIILPVSYEGDLSKYYLDIFEMPTYSYRRCAVDIEVKTEKGDINIYKASKPIHVASVVGSDGFKRVYLLDEEDTLELKEENEEIFMKFKKERDLIKQIFLDIDDYPIKLTFAGDFFDFPYLQKRAENLKLSTPFKHKREWLSFGNGTLHLDLNKFFVNSAVRIYMFGSRYQTASLKEVSFELFKGIKIDTPDMINTPLEVIGEYCLRDSELTLEMTTFDNESVMTSITMLCRLTNMDLELVTRKTISTWIVSTYSYIHRLENSIIPNVNDFKGLNPTKEEMEEIKGKLGIYKGGLVLDPIVGTHFGVYGLDFASMYPMNVKNHNISYDTINCEHEECKINNSVPSVEGLHFCMKKKGIVADIIGSFTTLRLEKYKKEQKELQAEADRIEFESPEEHHLLPNVKGNLTKVKAITGMLKVFLVAGYGVFGSEKISSLFVFYQACAIPAFGRENLETAKEMAEERGGLIVIGHTDSIFLKNMSKEAVYKLSEDVSKLFGIDFEVEKEYRYVSCYMKANYLTCDMFGRIVVKGLMVKKRNTPPFIKEAFEEIKIILKSILTQEDLEEKRSELMNLCLEYKDKILKGDIPLPKMAIQIQLGKNPREVKVMTGGKTGNQDYVVARLYNLELGRKLEKGDHIFKILTVKSKTVMQGYKVSAVPLECVFSYRKVNMEKYVEHLQTKMTQVLEPMGVSVPKAFGETVYEKPPLTRYFG